MIVVLGEGETMISTTTKSLDRLLCHAAVANFAAYTFAPPILVTPLGALSVLIG
jgi:hypothetical protein